MRLNFRHKIIGLSLFVGLLFWLLDAVLDLYYKPYAKTFIESLFIDEPVYDFYARILVLVLLTAFGIIVSIYVDKIRWIDTRYSKLFTSINDAIFIIECCDIRTNQYKISEVNRYASVMLGYQKEELLQLSFSDLITSKIPPEIPCLTETLTEEKHNVFEAEMERKGGGNLIVEISVYPGDVSGKPVTLLIARDITRRKISEEALLESEKQLGILASQLINAQETERQRISVGLHD
ncbi:MAG: PAS domain S-box protein, partial [Syntrophobacteraceae bacterium]